jgi:ethanolaminephosphotransferase
VIHAKHETKAQLIGAVSGLLPFAVLSAVAYSWLDNSPGLLTHHLVAFILYIGATFGLMVGRIILAHVVKSPFPYFHITYIPLLVGAVNAILPRFNM